MTDDVFLGKNFTTKLGGEIKILDKISRSGRTYFKYTCSICSSDEELYPEPFITTKYYIDHGNFNCGCSRKQHLNEEQHSIIAKRICKTKNYVFKGFTSTKIVNSDVVYECPKHGETKTLYKNFVSKGTGCSMCSGNKRKSLDEITIDLTKLCADSGYTFIGFPKGYKNQRSRFKYSCPIHGVNNSTSNGFINGNRCSGCSSHGGYDSTKPGWIYVYKYKVVGLPIVYKYGITNRDPKFRSSEHIIGLDMEISCNVYKRKFQDGCIPVNIEREIKQRYKGVCDWLYSGNTETVYEKDMPHVLSIIKEVTL